MQADCCGIYACHSCCFSVEVIVLYHPMISLLLFGHIHSRKLEIFDEDGQFFRA